MLAVFKKNEAGSVFLLVIITLLVKASYVIHPPSLKTTGLFYQATFFKWNGLYLFYQNHPSLYVTLSVILLFFFALYFNWITNREKLLPKKGFLPAVIFILFSSFNESLNIFSTAFCANLFVCIAFGKALQLSNTQSPRKACFDIGFFIAIASLFYFPSILFFILFLALIWLLRPFLLQETVAYLFGILTPIYVSIACLFLTGKPLHVQDVFNTGLVLPLKLISTWPLIITSGVSVALLFYSAFVMNLSFSKYPVGIKRKWNAVLFYCLVGCGAGVFSIIFPGVPWILAVTPISLWMTCCFMHPNERINQILFYVLLLIVLTIQWVLR